MASPSSFALVQDICSQNCVNEYDGDKSIVAEIYDIKKRKIMEKKMG
jgi:hypothetical protein